MHINPRPALPGDTHGMDAKLLAYAERQAPRYTSYPTAPQFGPHIDAARHRVWLGELPADAELSLYVHVPYCKKICFYCGCNTNAVHAGATTDYVGLILSEIDHVAAASSAKRVTELHWGGGTPNILTPEEFTLIFEHLAARFAMRTPIAHGVEIDPRHLSAELAQTYANLGVNRASIGVQTLAPHVQHAIGRVQPFERVAQAVADLRAAGIRQLSFDLMYGLPGQTLDDLLGAIRQAATLRPQRVSLFGYAHVPWFKRRQRVIREEDLPNSEQRFEQAEFARAELIAQGFEPIGLDHFAVPGDTLQVAARERRLRRNFQGYVAQIPDAIIGFGPSAISTLPQGYVQNLTGIGEWRRKVEARELATARGLAFTEDDRRRAALIERIMCDFEADLSHFGGRAAFAGEIARLAPLAADGLVRIEGERIVVPEDKQPFCRLVAQAFDAYSAAVMQHSKAV